MSSSVISWIVNLAASPSDAYTFIESISPALVELLRHPSRNSLLLNRLRSTIRIVLTRISRLLQVLTTGLYTGLLFADRIGVTPIRPKLPASSFVLYQQELHIRFGKLMPVLLFGSVVAGVAWLVLERRHYRRREFIFTAIAIVCTVCVIILTRLINVPINETLMTWQSSSPPENVMQLWAPWEGSHTIRTAIALLGFVSLAYAVAVRPDNEIELMR